ncbi:hypothetical protein [Methanolobus vulcani]|uniref:Uncharacterized protein n=1 Tax=Methanolobus vulcani TaxID=38026 RepID=A0A7Z8KN47_9EURY|nr:hypothetical protein [Methanolobus vulcani]TQD25193.1 hypothetical protein FKV42_09080 [Methanolobus vulcani]
MVVTGEVIGYIIGLFGVVLALYSIIKQKKLEERLKEKEKLKLFSTKIKDELFFRIDCFSEITNPHDDEDTYYQLDSLGRDVIATSYENKQSDVIVETSTEIRLKASCETESQKEKELSAENKDFIFTSLVEGKCNNMSLWCSTNSSSGLVYDMDGLFIRNLLSALDELDKLEHEFRHVIQEFKPELFLNLRTCIQNIFHEIVESASYYKEIVVHITDFDKADDIGLWIYNLYLGMDKVLPLIEELKEIEENLDKFREKLVLTSYT